MSDLIEIVKRVKWQEVQQLCNDQFKRNYSTAYLSDVWKLRRTNKDVLSYLNKILGAV